MLTTYKVKEKLREVDKGDIITFDTYDGVFRRGESILYIFNYIKNDKPDKIYIHNYEDFKYIIDNKLELIKTDINIPSTCEPFMFNTNNDLNKFEKGDVVSIKFQDKSYNGKYKGKTIDFIVMDYMEYSNAYKRFTKRLALVTLDKESQFTEDDILYLDDYYRFSSLIIDLFPINRIPYKGWKNKEVEITINNNLKRERKIDSILIKN